MQCGVYISDAVDDKLYGCQGLLGVLSFRQLKVALSSQKVPTPQLTFKHQHSALVFDYFHLALSHRIRTPVSALADAKLTCRKPVHPGTT